jgi:hypothetical protein
MELRSGASSRDDQKEICLRNEVQDLHGPHRLVNLSPQNETIKHISVKGENLPGRPQRPAQRRAPASPEGFLTSAHNNFHGTGIV